MSDGRVVINVDAVIKATESSIAGLKQQLNSLQPDSSKWKEVNKEINTMQKNLLSLRAANGKDVTSKRDMTAVERYATNIEQAGLRAREIFKDVKFGDLKVDAQTMKQLDNFEQQMNEIEENFKAKKESIKRNLFNDQDFDAQLSEALDLKNAKQASKQSLNQIISQLDEQKEQLEKKVQEISNVLKTQQVEASPLKQQVEVLNQIRQEGITGNSSPFKNFFGAQGQLLTGAVARSKIGEGVGGGTKKEVVEYLISQMGLDSNSEVVQELVQSKVSEIAQKIQSILQSTDIMSLIPAEAQQKIRTEGETSAQLMQLESQQSAVENASIRVTQAINETRTAAEQAATAEQGLNQQVENLTGAYENEAKSSNTVKDTTDGLTASIERFKTNLKDTNAQYMQIQQNEQTLSSIKMAVTNFMGFYQVLNLVKRGVQEAANHIKQLDTVMNGIAIVSDMNTADLWNQVDAYSALAQQYGVSIQGAYEVSQIYYQAGYETDDVMTLMNETLKLSKISGLDYATTTNYMMTATRGFHMEVAEAATVVDVYSNLAAHTAVSQQELAEAMSRTASSLEGVGMSFQESSAMIATMEAATRETAYSIGTALKSIASRYGELKKDPLTLVDEEGEALSFNKVDDALQSVGISLKDTQGQFRNMTDVILELSDIWDTLETNQQRYIATQFAGNRMQSRFLALVSNGEELRKNIQVAENADDTGTLQALEALDSLESKINQVQVAYQQFYTGIGIESVWKSALDGIRNFIDGLNSLPKAFGKIPLNAIATIANAIGLVKSLLTGALSEVSQIVLSAMNNVVTGSGQKGQESGQFFFQQFLNELTGKTGEAEEAGRQITEAAKKGAQEGTAGVQPNEQDKRIAQVLSPTAYVNPEQVVRDYGMGANEILANAFLKQIEDAKAAGANFTEEQLANIQVLGQAIGAGEADFTNELNNIQQQLSSAGNTAEQTTSRFANVMNTLGQNNSATGRTVLALSRAFTTFAMTLDKTSTSGRTASGILTTLGGTMQSIMGAAQISTGNVAQGISNLTMGLMNVMNGFSLWHEDPEEKLKNLEQAATEASNAAKQSRADTRELQTAIDNLKELKKHQYDSEEAAEEYRKAMNDLGDSYPQLISAIDDMGNATVEAGDAEILLANLRRQTAKDTYEAAQKEYKLQEEQLKQAQEEAENRRKTFTTGGLGIGISRGAQLAAPFSEDSVIRKFLLFYGDMEGLNSDNLLVQLENQGEFFQQFRSINNLAPLFKAIQTAPESAAASIAKDVLQLYAMLDGSFEDYTQQYGDVISSLETERAETSSFNIEKKYDEFKKVLLEEPDNLEKQMALYVELTTAIEAAKSQGIADDNVDQLYDDYLNYLTEWANAQKDLQTAKELLKLQASSLASSWMQYKDKNYSEYSDYGNVVAFIGEQITSIFESSDNLIEDLDNEGSQTQVEARDITSKWSNFVKNAAIQGRGDILNQMLGDATNYNWSEFKTQFSSIEGFNDISDQISSQLTEKQTALKETTKNYLLSLVDSTNIAIQALIDVIDRDESFTAYEAEIYRAAGKIIQSAEKAGLTGQAQKIAEDTSNLMSIIADLPYDMQRTISLMIEENGALTYEQWQKTKEGLKDLDLDEATYKQLDDEITEIQNGIVNSIPLTLQTSLDNLTENWDDTEKTLKKVVDGFDIDEVADFMSQADRLGVEIDFDSFYQVGEKLVLADEKQNEYIEAWNKKQLETISHAQLLYEGFSNNFDTIGELTRVNLEKVKQLSKENFSALLEMMVGLGVDAKQYFKVDESGKILNEYTSENGAQLLNEALEKGYANSGELIQNYNKYLAAAARSITQAADFSKGRYEEALGTVGYNKLLMNAGHVNQFDKETQNSLYEAQNSLNNAYSSLLSDAISKGYENLNISDYEGLLDKNINFTGSYQQLVEEYIEYAGLAIEDANKLMADAIVKDNSGQTNVTDALKNITKTNTGRMYGDLDDIQKLATALGIDITEILGEYSSELEAYTIKGLALAPYLEDIDGAAELLADSVRSFIENIVEQLEQALDGEMTASGVANFKEQLIEFGLDKDYVEGLDFHQTVDGLKLSNGQAADLYNRIAQIDAIAGRLAFSKLSESMTEAGGGLDNIVATTGKIAELQREIAKNEAEIQHLRATGGNDQKIKEIEKQNAALKNQLSLYQQIQREQAMDKDSYDFMNNKLPDYLQGPVNYWDSLGDMMSAMDDAGKSGRMKVQDFYNIINQMNSLAQISGSQLQFMGETLDGSAESAAALISKGFSALDNVDGKGVMINLQKIGLQFAEGADGLGEGFEDSIHSMAQSQIDMLDAMIQLLETVVAMEKLGDIDVDNNGILDFGELFTAIGNEQSSTQLYKATQQAQLTASEILNLASSNEDLANALDSVKMGDKTVREMMTDLSEGTELTKEQAQIYQAALQSLYTMSLSGDYNLDDLSKSIMDVAKVSGFTGEISVGDSKFYVTTNGIVEMAENGAWKGANGKTYTDPTLAANSVYLESVDKISNATYDADRKEIVAEYTNGKVKILVHLDEEGNIVYEYNGEDYSSPNKAMHAQYLDWAKEQEAQAKEAGKDIEIVSYETWRQERNVTFDTVFNGDFSSTENRSEVTKILTMSNEELQAQIDAAGAGGVLTFGNNLSMEVGDGLQADQVKTQILEMMGIDTLVVAIQTAIQQAFSDGTIGSTLATAISDALNGKATTADGVPIPGITLNPEGIIINLDALLPELQGQLTEGAPIDSYTAALTTLLLSAVGANAEWASNLTNIPGTLSPETLIATVALTLMYLSSLGATNEWAATNGTDIGTLSPEILTAIAELTGLELDASAITNPAVTGLSTDPYSITNVVNAQGTLGTLTVVNNADGNITISWDAVSIPEQEYKNKVTAKVTNIKWEYDGAGDGKVSVEIKNLPDIEASNLVNATAKVSNVEFVYDTNSEGEKEIKGIKTTLEDGTSNDYKFEIGIKVNGDDVGTQIQTLMADANAYETAAATAAYYIAVAPSMTNADEFDTALTTLQEEHPLNVDTKTAYTNIQTLLTNILSLFAGTPIKLNVTMDSPEIATGSLTGKAMEVGYVENSFKDVVGKAPEEYLSTLQQIVASGGQLSQLDLNNLQNLSNGEWSSYLSDYSDTAQQILDDATALSDGSAQIQTLAEAFSQIDGTNLATVVTALGEMATNANLLVTTTWDTISSGLNDVAGVDLSNVDTNLQNILSTVQGLASADWMNIANGIGDIRAAGTLPLSGYGYDNYNTGGFQTIGYNTQGNQQNQQLTAEATEVDATGATIDAASATATFTSATIEAPSTTINATGATISGITLGGSDSGNSGGKTNSGSGTGSKTNTQSAAVSTAIPSLDISGISTAISNVQAQFNSVDFSGAISAVQGAADKFTSAMQGTMNSVPSSKTVKINVQTPGTQTINVTAKVNVQVSASGGTVKGTTITGPGSSKSPLNLKMPVKTTTIAKGQNQAFAAGSRDTLIGELGAELVVSNGRYFLAGTNGPEFINLDKDAIVFNHLQTQRLLKNKRMTGRGTPITNEKNAVSFATGNVEGPAFASASAALAALKQIRSMWQSLLSASLSDLGSGAGSGGGGGGGGGGGDKNNEGYIHDLEIWYNLLRQIDHLETEISYQQQLQNKLQSDQIANGQALYDSYKKNMNMLQQEVEKRQELADLQKQYYKQRVTEFEKTTFGKLYTYDDAGLMQMRTDLNSWIQERTKESRNFSFDGTNVEFTSDGKLKISGTTRKYDEDGNVVTNKKGKTETTNLDTKTLDLSGYTDTLDFLSMLNATDEISGAAIYTADEQVALLRAFGFGEELKYDTSGKEIKESDSDSAQKMVEAFWEKNQAWIDELDSLYDSYHEQAEAVVEPQNELNETIQKLIDNQIEVEQAIEKAIEEREQARIDELKDEKEALEEASQDFLDGLNEQLENERKMYERQDSDKELTKLQRQLAILQRSGGSASQIKSLQDQIAQKQRDAYFDAQQEQIDAIQDASDKQIERLDDQISLMEESLDYQKEHGLLWNEVYEVMKGTPDSIMSFIKENTFSYQSESETQMADDLREIRLKVETYTAERDDKIVSPAWDEYLKNAKDSKKYYDNILTNENLEEAEKKYRETYGKTQNLDEANAAATAYLDEKNAEEQKRLDDEAAKNKEQEVEKPKTTYWGEGAINKGQFYTYTTATSTDKGAIISDHKKGAQFKIIQVQGNRMQMDEVYDEGKRAPEFDKRWINWNSKYQTRKQYATGGLIDYTGPAWVDGTKSRPEMVLNAEQTKMMSGEFWQGIEGALQALNEMQSNWMGVATHPGDDMGNGTIVIEEANVNMHVQSIANDYDARRAGENALEEMVKIARKSGLRSVSRR